MFGWLKKLKAKTDLVIRKLSISPSPYIIDFEKGIAESEKYIELHPEVVELPIEHPIRLRWNWLSQELGNYFLGQNNFSKGLYYFKKVSFEAPHASFSYYEAANIYLNIFKNKHEALYYFELAARKGNADAEFLSAILKQQLYEESLQKRMNYYRKLGIQQPKNLQVSFNIQELSTKANYNNEEVNAMQNSDALDKSFNEVGEIQVLPEEVIIPAGSSKEPIDLIGQNLVLDEEKIPTHLKKFKQKLIASYPTTTSSFYNAVKKLVEECKAELEKEKPWFFKEVLDARKQDIKELEDELTNGLSKIHFNDQVLILLCQTIANQELPLFFNWGTLPKKLKGLLEKMGKGELQTNFVGTQAYETLQQQTAAAILDKKKKEEELEAERIKHLSMEERLELRIKKLDEKLERERQAWKEEKQKIEEKDRKEKEEREAKSEREKQEREAKYEREKQEWEAKFERQKQEYEREKHEREEKERIEREKRETEFKNEIKEQTDKYNEILRKNDLLTAANIAYAEKVLKNQNSADAFRKYTGKNLEPAFFSFNGKLLNDKEPPEYLCCPISKELMTKPVIASDGFTYQKESLDKMIEYGYPSPFDGKKYNPHYYPNRIVEDLLSDWLHSQKYGIDCVKRDTPVFKVEAMC